MTNAYVAEQVMGKDGEIVTVKYKDGEQKIVVTPEMVIAAVAPGSASDLKPGAGIVIFASEPQPDGSVVAKSVNVGRDVAPVMRVEDRLILAVAGVPLRQTADQAARRASQRPAFIRAAESRRLSCCRSSSSDHSLRP
jgi:hypothetical protein